MIADLSYEKALKVVPHQNIEIEGLTIGTICDTLDSLNLNYTLKRKKDKPLKNIPNRAILIVKIFEKTSEKSVNHHAVVWNPETRSILDPSISFIRFLFRFKTWYCKRAVGYIEFD